MKKIINNILPIISIIFIIIIIYINILPIKYLFILVIILTVINIIIKLLIKKKTLNIILNITISILLLLGIYYTTKTNNILKSTNKNYITYNYQLIVLKESNYNSINDINNKTIGYYNNSSNNIDNSIKKINTNISTIEYKDIYNLTENLLNNQIDAILLEESYINILKENTNLENFTNNTKTIYSLNIKNKINNISKDIDITKESFNIYISGIDTYGDISSISRSDVNIIVTINPITKQILLTSIPRDYYVELYNKKGYKDKLTHTGLYGIDTSVKTIETLLDIDINYYIKLNFSSIINIINSLNGVTVYSDYEFISIDGYKYKKGYNNLNGEEALSYVRERKAFKEGDNQRIKNQQYLIEAIYKKCINKNIIINYNDLLESLKDSYITNIPLERIVSLIREQISNNYKWTINNYKLYGIDSYNYTYSMPSQKIYVMNASDESINKAKTIINIIINGENNIKEVIKQENLVAK